MPDWAKTGIIVGGILASNFLTNGIQYGTKTAPTQELAAERETYGVASEKRLYTCQDRLSECQEALFDCRFRETEE